MAKTLYHDRETVIRKMKNLEANCIRSVEETGKSLLADPEHPNFNLDHGDSLYDAAANAQLAREMLDTLNTVKRGSVVDGKVDALHEPVDLVVILEREMIRIARSLGNKTTNEFVNIQRVYRLQACARFIEERLVMGLLNRE